MAFQSYWFFTNLPSSVIDIIEKDIVNVFDQNVEDSVLLGGDKNNAIRDSKNAWIPTSHWIGGFLWHYAERANRENFLSSKK